MSRIDEKQRRRPVNDPKRLAAREVVARASGDEATADEWLTLKECADRLKVSYPTIQRWVYGGVLPSHVLIGGRGRRVRASDLEAAMGEPVEGGAHAQ